MGKRINIALILFVLVCTPLFAKSNGPIYKRILELQPNIDKNHALVISRELYKCHKKTNIDRFLLVAILNQESKMTLKENNCTQGVLTEEAAVKILENLYEFEYPIVGFDYQEKINKLKEIHIRVCSDFGVAQINIQTTKRLKVCADVSRLKTDIVYNINCACEVLSELKKDHKKKEPHWWTRYNSSNPEKRKMYQSLVERYAQRN